MINPLFILPVNHLLCLPQCLNIFPKNPGNIFLILQADMLPHGRRRRSNSGDILKSTGCKILHQFLLSVRIPHKIHKTGRNNMRKVADSPGHIIMFPVIKENRDCPQSLHELHIPVNLLPGRTACRRQYIICILNQHCLRIHIAALLRPRHGMPSDKIRLKPQSLHLPVDIRLHTPHVRQDTVLMEISCNLLQISRIIRNRRTQEYIAALMKIIINRSCSYINHRFLRRQRQRLLILIKCHNLIIRKILPDCPCNRPANQSQTNKPDFLSHNSSPLIGLSDLFYLKITPFVNILPI